MEIAPTGLRDGGSDTVSMGMLESYMGRITAIAPALIYVYNQKLQTNEYSNRNVGEVLGYSAAEIQAMGPALMLELLHPEDIGPVFNHFEHIKSLSDEDVASIEYRIKNRAGDWVWLLSQDCVFQRDASGAVTHHIGAAIDISKQKKAEAEARLSERRAQANNQELKDFAYAMSHDIKAPANTLELILGELKQLADLDSRKEEAELIDMALTTTQRTRQMIDDILEYTRVIEEDTVFETVDLQDIFNGLQNTLFAALQANQGSLSVGSLPRVKGSALQLSSLFQNLVENGLKFAKPDVPPRVEVFATENHKTGTATIHVKDNGLGIPAHQQEEIFNLFNRLHRKDEFDGTGLGLAICRRVATNHGREIQIASSEGAGADFFIELDIA